MRKGILVIVLFFAISYIVDAQEIKWYSFEEAVALSKEKPKKLLIDIYTDWCGWCKKMDADAYSNQHLVDYINKNYYAVKFNAEQKEDIEFSDHTFKFLVNGRRGVHELAIALTNNKLSYPTTVFMDEEFRIIQPIAGYMTAKDMAPILAYFGENKYTDTSWSEFQKDYKNPVSLSAKNSSVN
ncbi:MAG: thioredoxin family protein [Bacteroidota bacterium]